MTERLPDVVSIDIRDDNVSVLFANGFVLQLTKDEAQRIVNEHDTDEAMRLYRRAANR